MPSAGQIIGLFAIAAYLSAAFLPCESSNPVFFSVPAAVEAHGMPVAAKAVPSEPLQSHHESHRASHENHDAHDTRNASASHHELAAEASVVWMPTCLCGCADSRAQIAGGSTRLGPVVPVTFAAHLPSATIIRAARTGPRLRLAPDYLIDPIPT